MPAPETEPVFFCHSVSIVALLVGRVKEGVTVPARSKAVYKS